MKKVPIRTCVVTRESLPKQELVRVVKSKDGKVEIDLTGRKNGRGAYLKKDKEVFNKAKKGILKKALGIDIPEEIFEELNNLL
jgi:predicted RNA-binding protein YlxR (DUF448 family)